jgi:hypothetical protein
MLLVVACMMQKSSVEISNSWKILNEELARRKMCCM